MIKRNFSSDEFTIRFVFSEIEGVEIEIRPEESLSTH